MSRHERQDDEDKYTGNGQEPTRPSPSEDSGGKHEKPDEPGNDDPND